MLFYARAVYRQVFQRLGDEAVSFGELVFGRVAVEWVRGQDGKKD